MPLLYPTFMKKVRPAVSPTPRTIDEENLTRSADAALKVRWVRVEPTCDASGGAVWDACLIETQSSPTWVTIGRVAGSKARTATDANVRVKCAWEGESWVPATSSGRRSA